MTSWTKEAYEAVRTALTREFWKHLAPEGATEHDAKDHVDEKINDMSRTEFMDALKCWGPE